MVSIFAKSFATVLIVSSTLTAVQAQSVLNYWSAKAGFTLAIPTVTIDNITYSVSEVTGYQVAVGRFLPIRRGVGVQLSGGLIQMRSTLRNARSFTFDQGFSSTYGLLEAGLKGEKPIRKFTPFGIIAFRGSRLFRDNWNDVFFLASRSSADYGLSLSVGTEYELEKVSPFVEFSYYYGLSDIVFSAYTDDSGQIFRSEIANRSWAFLVGIRF